MGKNADVTPSCGSPQKPPLKAVFSLMLRRRARLRAAVVSSAAEAGSAAQASNPSPSGASKSSNASSAGGQEVAQLVAQPAARAGVDEPGRGRQADPDRPDGQQRGKHQLGPPSEKPGTAEGRASPRQSAGWCPGYRPTKSWNVRRANAGPDRSDARPGRRSAQRAAERETRRRGHRLFGSRVAGNDQAARRRTSQMAAAPSSAESTSSQAH